MLGLVRQHQETNDVKTIQKNSEKARQKSLHKTQEKQKQAEINLQKRLALRQRAKQSGVLKKCKPFAKLKKEGESAIIDAMSYTKIKQGSVLCVQGDVADCMYILMTGRCKVVVDEGTVAVLKELDIFGEAALFSSSGDGKDAHSCRTATVTAMEEVEVLVLSRGQLASLLQSGYLNDQCMIELKEMSKMRQKQNESLSKIHT